MKKNKNLLILLTIILLNTINLLGSKEIKEELKLFSNLENEIISSSTENTNETKLDFKKINDEIKEKSNSKLKNFYLENSFKKKYDDIQNFKNLEEKKEITSISSIKIKKPLFYKFQEIQIKESNKIKYPNGKTFSNLTKDKKNLTFHFKDLKDVNTTKIINKSNKDSKIYIEKSSKIYYPNDDKIKESISGETFFKKDKFKFIYYIKVYPNRKNDDFTKLLNLDKNFFIKKDENCILIGPILKDNLGMITKIIKTRGYNLVEYVKNII